MTVTIDPRLFALPVKADQTDDKHPEVLREWTQDGHRTPPNWYHVAAYTAKGHIMQLLRERHHDDSDRTQLLNRTIYWHVSEEYVREVGRQLLAGERQAFAWSIGNSRFVAYPVGHVIISWCDDAGEVHDIEKIMAPDKPVEADTEDPS